MLPCPAVLARRWISWELIRHPRKRLSTKSQRSSRAEIRDTASWVLEGASPLHSIRGDNIVPGNTEDQGSYRSELAGLYGITLCVYALCEFYKIDQGTFEVGCDGITALERGFDAVQHPSIAAQHFDLILAIRNIRARFPISWNHRHVKGHQAANPFIWLYR